MDERMAFMFQQMLGSAMADVGIGGSDLSQCAEGNWSNHPIGGVFTATKDLDCKALSAYLTNKSYADQIDDWDGDGAPALTQLSFQSAVSEDVAKEIISLYVKAGANLNVRASKMMGSETPLHVAGKMHVMVCAKNESLYETSNKYTFEIATYGNLAVIKALVGGGAKVDISDDYGRTPFSIAKKGKPMIGRPAYPQAVVTYLKEAYKEEKAGNGPSFMINEAQAKRGEAIRKLADSYYRSGDYDEASEEYTKLLVCCGDDPIVLCNIAAANLEGAVDRIFSDRSGYRQKFRNTYEYAQKAVELDPTYERAYYILARGYLGYRELPRAKKTAKGGYLQCPKSAALKEIWDTLHMIGIPDEVVDHSSQEWKEIQHKIYVQRWIGDVACDCCALSCMSSPPPPICPFCNCPTSIDFDDDESIPRLTASDEYQYLVDDLNNDKATSTNDDNTTGNDAGRFSIGSNDGPQRGSIKKRTNKKKKGKGKGKGVKGKKK